MSWCMLHEVILKSLIVHISIILH